MKSTIENPESKIWEWEVLPPEKRNRAKLESLFRWVALVMDELITLPNTKFRLGIDPLIGLIPGIGDTASAAVSAVLLIQAARRGVPKILLARMSLNILVNELIGIIPGFGDAFSFWFKSNKRNYELLLTQGAGTRRATKSDWLFVIAVLGVLFIIVGAGIVVSFLLLRAIAHLLGL
jgi:Domain of unknown function (DUF4112)